MKIQNELDQLKVQEELEQLKLDALTELAFLTLTELIKIQREIGFWLMEQSKKKTQENFKYKLYALLRDIADDTHNLPNAIKERDKHTLVFELSLVTKMLSNLETQKSLEDVSRISPKHLLLEFKEYGIQLPILR